jgi:hypothetical protein
MNRQRRFSTAQQISPDTLKVIGKGKPLDSIQDVEEGETAPTPHRKQSIPGKLTATIGQLALFKDDDDDDKENVGGKSFISAFTTPGPKERASSAKKKADLGVMLGVYLPTIQHILGVTMFIRLFWVVGIAGVWNTLLLLFLCCSCVS